jgi:hypothetical protein
MSKRKHAPNLLQETLTKLEEAKQTKGVTLLQIYDATRLHPNWVSRLSLGKIPHPSITRVQSLHDYLMGIAA